MKFKSEIEERTKYITNLKEHIQDNLINGNGRYLYDYIRYFDHTGFVTPQNRELFVLEIIALIRDWDRKNGENPKLYLANMYNLDRYAIASEILARLSSIQYDENQTRAASEEASKEDEAKKAGDKSEDFHFNQLIIEDHFNTNDRIPHANSSALSGVICELAIHGK